MALDPVVCSRQGPAAQDGSNASSQASSPKSFGSPKGSGSPKGTLCLPGEVLDHVSCGICRGPVAASLLLSCSHLFCGDCLWRHLQKQQSCPTCSMALRSVPVRCMSMDKIAASCAATLPPEQQQQYAKRSKDGQSTADKVNKMFWFLAPALPACGLPGAGVSLGPNCMPAATGSMLPSIPGLHDPICSSGLQGIAASMPCLPGPFQQLLPAISCPQVVPPHLAAANASTQLLQLAAAAQFATVQQMAHGGVSLPMQPSMDLLLAHQQQQERQHFAALGPPGLAGYQQGLQLSSMMSSMCQV